MANEPTKISPLKAKLQEKIEAFRPRTQKLNKEFANVIIDQVNVGQAIGGARDVRCLVTDISYLDPQEGIRFRGKTIPETFAALPKVPGADQPFVEGFFYFLLTGDIPTLDQALAVKEDWKGRAKVPEYVFDVLRALPRDTHPMTMFSAAVLSMQRESVFAKRYGEGTLKKTDMWDPMFEDSMNLLAKLPQIAAYIYRMKYKGDTHIAPNPELDWGGNFAHMMASRARTTTSRACTSSCTRTTSRGTSPPTPRTSSPRRSPTRTTPCRPVSTASRARSTASRTRRCWAGSRTSRRRWAASCPPRRSSRSSSGTR